MWHFFVCFTLSFELESATVNVYMYKQLLKTRTSRVIVCAWRERKHIPPQTKRRQLVYSIDLDGRI